jgi:hypothetical protein
MKLKDLLPSAIDVTFCADCTYKWELVGSHCLTCIEDEFTQKVIGPAETNGWAEKDKYKEI